MRRSHRSGFSLIELLVVIGIVGILAAILFPMLTKVQDKGKQTKCLSNMRQLALAISSYAQDANGALPQCWEGQWSTGTWRERINPYLKSKKILECSTPTKDWRDKTMSRFSHYGMCVGLTHVGMANSGFIVAAPNSPFGYTYLNKVQQPSKTLMVAENKDGDWSCEPMTSYPGHWDSGVGDPGSFYPYHMRTSGKVDDYTGGGNFIFCDSHARYMTVNEAEGYDPTTKKRSFAYWIADKTFILAPK